MLSDGQQRTYRVHLPMGYQVGREYPLVMSFHGHGNNAEVLEQSTGFSQLADQQGFIVVYPQGIVGPDHLTGWATGPAHDPQVDDVLFVSELLTTLETFLCIDQQRLYATGFSNGGAMTNLLACKLSNNFAAFAPVAGAHTPVKGGCSPQRPVPILAIHGTADPIVPYTGDPSQTYPPVTTWLEDWARLNHCQPDPQIFYRHQNVLGEQWVGCQGTGALVHYRIDQGGHEWPRENSQGGINATQVIWDFFQNHPLH
jgi:polyhydroxybutyrate depolymerase